MNENLDLFSRDHEVKINLTLPFFQSSYLERAQFFKNIGVCLKKIGLINQKLQFFKLLKISANFGKYNQYNEREKRGN